jgi:tetratricopeptide (TPR) repeat protein
MTQSETTSETGPGKGDKFFKRAEEVAETGNWDFAIEMYLEGVLRDAANVERGHKPLRDVAMKRKFAGGKPAGMMEQLKCRPGRDVLINLRNTEYLLAKDPGNVQYMDQLFRAAEKLALRDVMVWMGDILLESQRQAPKANNRLLLMLAKALETIQEYRRAVTALDMALQVAPDDGELQSLLRNMSAKYTIKAGKYDTDEEGFSKSVKDMDGQKKLMQKDALVKDRGYLEAEIERARREYLERPTVPGKINGFVDALLRIEEEAYENEGIDVLLKAQRDTGVYQFKMRVGDIRMKQMSRRYRQLLESGEREAATEQARRQLAFELEEFAERAANYPTDMGIKFELGRRQFLAGKHDDAIASLQQAQRDPQRVLRASSLIGQAFARKGWFREAADTYERALKMDVPEERAKELRYNLGDVLEKMDQVERAQEQFSIVAQVDYNYKDVRERMEATRQKIAARKA